MTKIKQINLAAEPKTRKGSKESVITRIVEKFNSRSKKDLKDWRKGLDAAENILRPNRVPYLNLCDEIELDPHMSGVIQHGRVDKLFSEEFRVVNEADGVEDKDLTEFFRAAWFFEFMELALQKVSHGHSLIQVGDLVDFNGRKTIQDVQLIPRRHVKPEFGEIVVDQNDERGYPYRNDESMLYWLVEVGKPRDLGLFKKAAPIVLFKKNALSAWSEYCEIFGMPMRVGETTSRDKADIDRLESDLAKMGKSAYGIFPAGTTIKFIESTKGDAYNVYDKIIDRCNSELSKLFLGQTLTTDTGTSGTRAQGEVHERTGDDVTESDKRLIASVVKEKLMPLLERRGLKVQGKRFEFAEQKDLAALYTRTQGFLESYTVDPKWINDTFGIPVAVKEVTPPPDPNPEPEPEPEKKPAKPEKKKTELKWLDSLYTTACCSLHSSIKLAAGKQKDLDTATDELLQLIYDGKVGTFHSGVCIAMSNILIDSFIAGWKNERKLLLAYRNTTDLRIDYKSKDWETITMMEANLFRFSAAKTLSLVNELNQKLPDSKTFSDFKKNTQGLVEAYNTTHLRTEYNFAWQTSQNAAEYHRMLAVKETYPFWQYITAGDSRVRPAHSKLDKMTFRADDPAFNQIYPPNGWNCRCYVKPIRNYPEDKLSNEDKAIEALAGTEVDDKGLSEYDRMKESRMNVNRAKLGVVFAENQFYSKDLKSNLGVKDNGVKPYDDIDQAKLPKLEERLQERDETFAREWYKKNVTENAGVLTDYAERPLKFDERALKNHLKPRHQEEGRLNTLEFIPEALQSPDEVYLQQRSEGKYQYLYLKFYDSKILAVPAELDGNGLNIKTWFELDRQVDDRRSGILIKNVTR